MQALSLLAGLNFLVLTQFKFIHLLQSFLSHGFDSLRKYHFSIKNVARLNFSFFSSCQPARADAADYSTSVWKYIETLLSFFQKRKSTTLTPQFGFLNLFLQLFLPIFGHDSKRKLTNQSEGVCDVILAKTDLGKVGLLLS